MSASQFYKQLGSVLDNIDISDIELGAGGNMSDEGNDNAGEASRLARSIYSRSYLAGTPAPNPVPASPVPSDTILAELRAANPCEPGLDAGWIIERIESDGLVSAVKGNIRRIALPGDFILLSQEAPQKGHQVSLMRRTEAMPGHGSYYYIFGDLLAQDVSADGVRIYFDVLPNRAPAALAGLVERLNQLEVPFGLKCLVDPAAYASRSDNFVLYVDRQRINYVLCILEDLRSVLGKCLGERVPLFARKLHNGIGFGENPPDPLESFGMSRCRLIADALLALGASRTPRSEWLTGVSRQIEEFGFDLSAFYLNPGSTMGYRFPPDGGQL